MNEYPYWFQPVRPVNIESAKTYVDRIYDVATTTATQHFRLSCKDIMAAWRSHRARVQHSKTPIQHNIFQIFNHNTLSIDTFIAHFLKMYSLEIRWLSNMDVNEQKKNYSSMDAYSPTQLTDCDVSVNFEIRRGLPMTPQSYAEEVREALFQMYVEWAVYEVGRNENEERYKCAIGRYEPCRLLLGTSFLCARGKEFKKNDPKTWNVNGGMGSLWNTTYNSHQGRLLGYGRIMAVVVITVHDLPNYIKGNALLGSDTSSRESLALDIEDALGKPRTLMGYPLDNDPDEKKGRKRADGQGGSDASVVFVVYRSDLQRINYNLSEEVKHLSQRVDQLQLQLKPQPTAYPGSFRCGARRCTNCDVMLTGTQFWSSHTNEFHEIKQHINCKSKNVVFLITCLKCRNYPQYVGYTARKLGTRMAELLPSSKGKCGQLVHSGLSKHSKSDFQVIGIEWIDVEQTLLERRSFWIQTLKTNKDHGLNIYQ